MKTFFGFRGAFYGELLLVSDLNILGKVPVFFMLTNVERVRVKEHKKERKENLCRFL
jgi:hypothetical protein